MTHSVLLKLSSLLQRLVTLKLQPVWLCIMSDRWFENTFWNTMEIIQTNATYTTMHPLEQSTWGRSCKHTAEFSQTNATYVNMQAHNRQFENTQKVNCQTSVALIASCKQLFICIDCKTEFIPMSAFLCVTSLNFHEQIWTHTFGITIRFLHVWIWEVLPNFPWLAFYCHKCCIGYFVLHIQSSRERIR